jgi:hypothetical protein
MTCVPNGMGIVENIRYFPGGEYTMALLVVEPLHASPHRVPFVIALLIAFVSSYLLARDKSV